MTHATHTNTSSSQPLLRIAVLVGLVAGALATAGCSSTGSASGDYAYTPPPLTDPGGLNPDDDLALGGGNGDGSGNGNGNGNGDGGGNGGNGDGNGNGGNGDGGTQAGITEQTLANLGGAVDNVANTGLSDALGSVGAVVDPVADPVVRNVTQLTQQVGAATGLGQPTDTLLNQTGGAVNGLGQQISNSGLPLGLDAGLGGLTQGLGDAVASAGGLLHASPDNPQPLLSTLNHATNAVGRLTQGLTGEGGLLAPITGAVVDGSLLGLPGQPVMAPALGNVGMAADNLAPIGLTTALTNIGATLDTVVSPVAQTTTHFTQSVGDATGLGQPVDSLLNNVGATVAGIGGTIGVDTPLGVGNVLSHLGDTIANAGGILHAGPGNENPIGSTLGSATNTLAALTEGIGGSGGLLAPVTATLGNLGATDGGGLLAPVTGILGGGGILAPDAGAGAGGLLAPVTDALTGTGGILAPVTGAVTGGSGGLLAPVTNVVGSVTAPVTGAVGGSGGTGGGLLGGGLGGIVGGLLGSR